MTTIPKPEAKVAVIVKKDTDFLLCRDSEGKWILPSYPVQAFKSLPDIVKAKIWEETKLEITPGAGTLFVTEVIKEPFEHYLTIYLSANYVKGNIDNEKFHWIDVRKLYELKDDMPDITTDALYKYSLILRAQSLRRIPSTENYVDQHE